MCAKTSKKSLKTDNNFLAKIVMNDKSWNYVHDLETKLKPTQQKSPHPLRQTNKQGLIKYGKHVDFLF